MYFSKKDLSRITTLMQSNNLAEVSRRMGFTDNRLQYLRKKNIGLDKAIKKGKALRSKDFNKLQAQKFTQIRKDLYRQQLDVMNNYIEISEEEAIARYREIVKQRKLEMLKKELKEIDLL